MQSMKVVTMSEATYKVIAERSLAVYGCYVAGCDYICVKDDSLLDTQILLIDECGEKHWEDYRNFLPNLTPYKVEVTLHYQLDLMGDQRYYSYLTVWYRELPIEQLIEREIKQATRRCHHEVKVVNVREC